MSKKNADFITGQSGTGIVLSGLIYAAGAAGTAAVFTSALPVWMAAAAAVATHCAATGFVVTSEKRQTAVNNIIDQFSKVADPGFSFKLPWPFNRVHAVVKTSLRTMEDSIETKTKAGDEAIIGVPAQIQYRVKDAYGVLYDLEEDPEEYLHGVVFAALRQEINQLEVSDVYNSRDELEEKIKGCLDAEMSRYFEIIRVNIGDPGLSEDLRRQFDEVSSSKRQIQIERNHAEALVIKRGGEGESLAAARGKYMHGLAEQRAQVIKGTPAQEGQPAVPGMPEELVDDLMKLLVASDTVVEASKGQGSTILLGIPGGETLASLQTLTGGMRNKPYQPEPAQITVQDDDQPSPPKGQSGPQPG